jgi:glyoxylase-like metal-dependent hydrolase (beta-lactamase superfamily II)
VLTVFDQLGEGVFRRRYESLDLNIGVVLGEDGVLIVDSRATTREAAELKDDLRRLTNQPVRWVVNTHWHWDHVFGNSEFADAEIWGHELAQVTLTERPDEMKQGAKGWLPPELHPEIDEVVIVPPQHVFSDRASLAIGRDVVLTYHGLAHTDADIVIRVPEADVAFYGDMIEEGAPPNFGDSHPLSWPLTLRLASAESATTVVPGHGDVVDEAFMRAQHDELVAVAEMATSFVNGEVDLEEGSTSGPYPADVMRRALLRAQAVA